MLCVYDNIRQDISWHCFLGLNLAFSGISRKTVVSTKNVTGLLDAHFYEKYKKYKKSIKNKNQYKYKKVVKSLKIRLAPVELEVVIKW